MQSLKLAFLSGINLLTNIGTTFALLNIYGVTIKSDTFFLALAIPTFLYTLQLMCLNNLLLPFFSRKESLDLERFASAVLNKGIIISIFITIFAIFVLNLQYLQFSNLFVTLSSINFLAIPLIAIHTICWSLLNSKSKHIESEYMPTIFNFVIFLCLIISVYKFENFSIYLLASWFPLRFLFPIFFMLNQIKNDLKIKLNIFNSKNKIDDDYIKNIKNILIGNAIYKSDILVDRYILSLLDAGFVTIYIFAQQSVSAVSQLISKSIIVILFTKLSNLYNESITAFKKSLSKYFKVVLLISITIFAFLVISIFLLREAVEIYLNIDNFIIFLYVLIILSLWASFNNAATLTSNSYYISNQTSIQLKFGVSFFLFFIPIKIFAAINLGLLGLALAVLFWAIFTAIFFNIYLLRVIFANE